MADWNKIIKTGILSVELKAKKVKITCNSKEDGAEVYKAISSNYATMGVSVPERTNKGLLNYKDFTLVFSSKIAAQEMADALNAIINDSSISTSLLSLDEYPSDSYGSSDVSGNAKPIIIAAVAGVVILGILTFVLTKN